jgi:ABC-type nickel/cobalt efflux system permease component RcnA
VHNVVDKKSKINDKDRVLSLLNFFLVYTSLKEQQLFDFATYILTAGLLFLTASLIFIELGLRLAAILLGIPAALILFFGILLDLKRNADINKENRETRERIKKVLSKYEKDEESKALIEIIFSQKSKNK